MQKRHKDLLRTLVNALRAKLVGTTALSEDKAARGNLDRELERLGIAPDGSIKPIEALPNAREHEFYAYHVAVEQLSQLPIEQRPHVRSEIIERAAYTWINRLLALRAMEVRALIDNTLHGEEAYGGISERLFVLRETQPARANGEDGGWWAVLEDACTEQAQALPGFFALDDPAAALRPGASVLAQCVALVVGALPNFTQAETDAALADPDAIGWAYQFYQEASKAEIDAKCKSGGKVGNRSELAAKTQLFTEPYMVQWLLQNSLGRSYHEAYPQSALPAHWPYYVQPGALATDTYFTLASLTLLDPCMGSGHFLRAAFDLFVEMYHEQYPIWSAREIADRILSEHLHGIDLDPRAAQLTALTLYLRAWELVRDERRALHLRGAGSYTPPTLNLATTPTNLNTGALARHLKRHPQDELFRPLIEEIFAGLEQAEVLGSLLRPREYLDRAITSLQTLPIIQRTMFSDANDDELDIERAAMAKRDRDELKKLAMQRVIESFHTEVHNVNDISAMLFGREAEQGVRLLQLLDRQYAIVATNPPYMGSRYMDVSMRKFIEKHYKPGKRDLYATFILRCRELCLSQGRMAMVTMQGWMFLRSFANLRFFQYEQISKVEDKEHFTGLLDRASLEGIVHLGRYAFSEIGNAVVIPVLFIVKLCPSNSNHQIWSCRLASPRISEEQNSLLLKAVQMGEKSGFIFTPYQNDILNIPETPIVYWLRPNFFAQLRSTYRLQNIAEIRQGLATGDNERFLRCFWETRSQGLVFNKKPQSGRWFWYAKGGSYKKWAGLMWLVVDWENSGQRIKSCVNFQTGQPRFRDNAPQFAFKLGLTYTLMASGSFGTRILNEALFDVGGTSIFPKENILPLLGLSAMVSSHFVSYILRVMTQDLKFNAGYVSNLPLPLHIPFNIFNRIGTACTKIKNMLVVQNPVEQNFIGISYMQTFYIETVLHTLEGWNEQTICHVYELNQQDLQAVIEETGTPAGWYPLITNYDTLPALPDDLDLPALPPELFEYLASHERISPDAKELARIKAKLRALYEAGPGAKDVEQEEHSEAEGESEEEEGLASGAHIPIPTETFLEALSVKSQLHPISVYWLLAELRTAGARCKPEEIRLLEDRLSVLVLRLLGHRWPTQIEAGEAGPAWAERSGIIPLVGGMGKMTLAERLRERLRQEDGDLGAQRTEALLVELTNGQNLDEWLRRRFFPRHISQFKMRPVAWQLASTPVKLTKDTNTGKKSGGVQRKPAFECVLYYHACSTTALARVRNEFVEPLIQAERSKLEQKKREAAQNPLADDTTGEGARASERMRELAAFVQQLRQIEEQGFACADLTKLLADEPLDRWSGDGYFPPSSLEELLRTESAWHVDSNDGVRVNIAPLQLAGVLANDVLKAVDARKAVADRARWRSDERRWTRAGKLPRCGWLDEQIPASPQWEALEPQRLAEQHKLEQKRLLLQQGASGDLPDEPEAHKGQEVLL